MVQVYVPAERPVADAAVPPLGAHEYAYGPVPPAVLTAAEPSLPPAVLTLTCEVVAVNKVG
ncbi:hypothetical protein D3C78_1670110 [compost metagenome]